MFVNDLFKLTENSNEQYYAVYDQRGKPMIMRPPKGKTAKAYAEEKNYRIKGGPFDSHRETESFWIRSGLPNKKQDVVEGSDNNVYFEVDSENAYDHVMEKFGSVIEWEGDTMVAPRKYWGAIQELVYSAGGEATEVGSEQVMPEGKGFRGTGGGRSREDDERADLDPTDWYIVKDGKMFSTSVYPRQVAQAQAQGFSRTREQARERAGSQGVAEAIPYALSAANAAAEYRRQGAAGGGYRGRIDMPVQSREDYLAAGQALTKAARAAGQKIEYGLSDGVMSIFSDTMTADELDEFIDNVLGQGLAEGIGENTNNSFIQKLSARLQQLGYTMTQEGNVYRWIGSNGTFVEVEPDTEDPGWYGWAEGQVARSGKLNYGSSGNDSAKDIVAIFKSGGVFRKQGVAEGSVQDKLYQRHQEIRKKRGAPDPEYYQELKATFDLPDEERFAKAAELKKKYKITNEDVEKYVEELERAGYEIVNERKMTCPECGGAAYADQMLAEKQDACYHKVKSRYKVWPSAYASGALVRCRKKGAANWGNKSKK